jgi:hypothetical protein
MARRLIGPLFERAIRPDRTEAIHEESNVRTSNRRLRARSHLAGFASALAITALMTLMLTSSVAATGPTVAHQVSAGGPDACAFFGLKPGCDANYSFVGTQFGDGSATGQYTDRFPRGDGIKGVIDCIRVVGDEAWVSGVITSGRVGGDDLTGLPFTTLVIDNGTTANDPPDQISNSHTGDPTPCTDMVRWNLFDVPQGQVSIN